MRVGDFLAATDIYSSQVKKPRDLVIIFKSNGIIYHFNAVSIYRYTHTHTYTDALSTQTFITQTLIKWAAIKLDLLQGN